MDNFKKKLSHFFLLDETDLEETEEHREENTETMRISSEHDFVKNHPPQV